MPVKASTRSSPPSIAGSRPTWRIWCCRGAPTCRATATVWQLLFGNTGNNILDGGTGADAMSGGAGNDTYFVDNAGERAREPGRGQRRGLFDRHNYGLSANVETLVLQGDADLQGFGNNLANTLFGNSGNNLLDGDTGADAMLGGTGNDTYFVDNAGDAVIEKPAKAATRSFDCPLRTDSERGDTGDAGQRRPAGLRQHAGEFDLRQQRQQSDRWRRGADAMVGGLGNDTYFVETAWGPGVRERRRRHRCDLCHCVTTS